LHAQLRQDFFQLVAQFVRLKNEAGILGAALHQFLAANCTGGAR
jgi:hypothetical protein